MHTLFLWFVFLRTKTGVHFVKLVSIGFVVILFGTCNKPAPCYTLMSNRFLHCYLNAPDSGGIVSPTNLTLRWTGYNKSTFRLYFGINKNNLPCIAQQSSNSFDLKNIGLYTTYYWRVDGLFPCHPLCTTVIWSFTTVPDTNLSYVFTGPGFTHIDMPTRIVGNFYCEGS